MAQAVIVRARNRYMQREIAQSSKVWSLLSAIITCSWSFVPFFISKSFDPLHFFLRVGRSAAWSGASRVGVGWLHRVGRVRASPIAEWGARSWTIIQLCAVTECGGFGAEAPAVGAMSEVGQRPSKTPRGQGDLPTTPTG